MKIMLNGIKAIGVLMMFVGGCSMDSDQTFLPFILAIAGVGICYIGCYLEDYCEWRKEHGM